MVDPTAAAVGTDPVTVQQLVAVLIAAFGGREGLKYVVEKIRSTSSVSRTECDNTHREVEKSITELKLGQLEISRDVKDILRAMAKQHPT